MFATDDVAHICAKMGFSDNTEEIEDIPRCEVVVSLEGQFNLSCKAKRMYADLMGWEYEEDTDTFIDEDGWSIHPDEIDRHGYEIASVVRELGRDACGEGCKKMGIQVIESITSEYYIVKDKNKKREIAISVDDVNDFLVNDFDLRTLQKYSWSYIDNISKDSKYIYG